MSLYRSPLVAIILNNIVRLELSGIKIDIQMEKVSLNVSENMNAKCNETTIISDVPKLPNTKMQILELSTSIVSE